MRKSIDGMPARLFFKRRKMMRLALAAAALFAAAATLSSCAEPEPLLAEPSVPSPTIAHSAAPAPTPSPEGKNLSRRTLTGDFDGDGLTDAAILTGYGQNHDEREPRATLAAYLGSGADLTYDFPGEYWDADSLYAGDFDGDGTDEIALFLVSWTSNYGGGNAFVLRVKDGALSELPYQVNENDELSFDQRGCIRALSDGIAGGFEDVIGVTVLSGQEKDCLRVQLPVDVRERMTAWYYDLAFNGKAWDTADMALGVAYGNELLPITPVVPEISAAHRPGFVEAALTFAGGDGETLPDKRYYEWDTGELSPTAYETAQAALRQLYDMTGILVERCYYDGVWRTLGLSLTGRLRTTFLSYGYGQTAQGDLLYIMNLNYKNENFPNSPIDPEIVIKPSGYESMTKPELALWYYENSSFGDRRPIVSAVESESMSGYVNLVLSTGEFYEIGFDEACGLPNSFYGPYAKGFSH